MKRTHFFPLALSGLLGACGGHPFDGFSQTADAGSNGGAGHSMPAGTGGASAGGVSAAMPQAPAAAGAANDVAIPDGGSAGSPGVDPPDAGPSCTPELCNGKDDDCDGTADEGCPLGFSPGNPLQRPAIGDSPGGTDFADVCADDELLVGLNVAVGDWLQQVTGICQKYSLHTNTDLSQYQYSLALGDKRSLLSHPASTTGVVQALVCRGGTVMVGVHISQQHTAYGQSDDLIVIPQISIDCAEPTLSLGGSSAQVEWQNVVRVGPISGTFANNQAWFEADRLATTELLTGFHGASGAWVDRVGLTASRLTIVLNGQ